MSTFYVEGSNSTLFNGVFRGIVHLNCEKSETDNTFTAQINQIEVYSSKGGYNFMSKWNIKLSSGNQVAQAVDYKFRAERSGGGSVWHNTESQGWAITVNGNADGTCPPIELSFIAESNAGVWYINGGYWQYPKSSYSANITSSVQSAAGGANNRSAPSITRFSGTLYKANEAEFSFSVTSYGSYTYWLQCQNTWGGWDSLSSGSGSSGESKTIHLQASGVRNYKLYVQNSGNGIAAESNPLSVDMSPPTATNINIVPNSAETGQIRFTSSSDVDWSLKRNGNIMGSGSNKSTTISAAVTLEAGGNNAYELTLSKQSYTFLSNTYTLYVDTTRPTITIDHIETSANNIIFTVSANTLCKKWRYTLTPEGKTFAVKESTFHTDAATTVSFTIKDAPMNESLTLTIYAISCSNAAEGSITTAGVKCVGVGYIGESMVTAYICVGKDSNNKLIWKGAVPYVCIGHDENNSPIWRYGSPNPKN